MYCRNMWHWLFNISLGRLHHHHIRCLTPSSQLDTRKVVLGLPIEEGQRQKRRQRSSLLHLGDGIDSIPCRTSYIFHQDDFKKRMKRMKRITATWRNGYFGEMVVHLVHAIPNHHLTKIDVLPKTFVQIILAAKWLGRHSSTYTSSNKQQRPLPFSSIVILLLCRILPHLYTNTPFSYYLLYTNVQCIQYIVHCTDRWTVWSGSHGSTTLWQTSTAGCSTAWNQGELLCAFAISKNWRETYLNNPCMAVLLQVLLWRL